MLESIVLIGAGSAMFTRGLAADLILRGQPCALALVDTDPAALAVAEGLVKKMIAARRAPITLRATTDRREVLPRATVVICTIGVGGRRAWEQDVFIPRKYGIYQPVGDTVMPGGTSRALRMIPAMVAIAEDVRALAPDALFFNYGNPMSAVCRGVRKATGANIVGLCHGVFHVAHYLTDLLGCASDALDYTAVGINHLTWFTDIRCGGQDAMPRLRAIAREKLARIPPALGQHFAEAGTAARGTLPPDLTDPFTWQLVELFGAFPAVLDRHVTEFFPWMFSRERSYFGNTLGMESYSFESCIAYGDQVFAEMQELAASPGPLSEDYFARIGGEHEQVTEIIDSIRQDTGTVYSVNLPNAGQVPNLPLDAVVESPAIARAEGLHPLPLPPMPAGLAGTLATRFQWVETIVEAALEGSREKFIQALLLDGAVESVATASALADELLTAQAAYLPRFAPSAASGA